MAENYDLIFGQSASSQYAWSDSDYQNGWQTVGRTPPTAAQFDALQRRADLKAQELNNRLAPIEENDTHDYRQPSTAYAVGNIAYHASLPTGYYLECTTGGTTSSGDLTISSPSIGGTVSDGTVVWTIRKIANTTEATTTTKGLMSAADKTKLNGVVTTDATTTTHGLMSAADKTKLNGVVTTDATTTTHGLMSAADKTKLNGIANNANNYSLPAATSSTRGGVTIGANISLSGDKISLTKGNVTNALGYTPPTHDYSLPAATSSTRGGVKIGSNISLSGDTISLAKANVTNALGYTPPTTNTTYSTGTASYSGITKLYTGTGDNTDGTMTQKAIKALVGNKAPVFTQIMDTNSGSLSGRVNNTSTGISGWDAATSIDLTQSYKNFDKILVVGANDGANINAYNLWDVWELQYMFDTSFLFSLFCADGAEWWVYGNTYHGTKHDYSLSTDVKWVTADQGSVICAVYGIEF